MAVPGRGVTAVDVVIEVDPLVVLPNVLNKVVVTEYRVDEFRPEIVAL